MRTVWPLTCKAKPISIPPHTGPINKYEHVYTIPDVVLAHVTQKIDRIQISVRNTGENFRTIFACFKKHLSSKGVRRVKGSATTKPQPTWMFSHGYTRVNLRFYNTYWFSVQLLDPSSATQRLIGDILAASVAPRDFCISQVEFAKDFYPANPDDLGELHHQLTHLTELQGVKKCRVGFKGSTYYQGCEANVRKGAQGLRIYPKQRGRQVFVRFELQLNHHGLASRGLHKASLPISAHQLEVMDQVVFREGLTYERLSDLARTMARTKVRALPEGKVAARVEKALGTIIAGRLYREVVAGRFGPAPVAEQIYRFRVAMKNRGRQWKKDDVFPVKEVKY